jgi:hypothetical protein
LTAIYIYNFTVWTLSRISLAVAANDVLTGDRVATPVEYRTKNILYQNAIAQFYLQKVNI